MDIVGKNIEKGEVVETENNFLSIGSGSLCRIVAINDPSRFENNTLAKLGKEFKYGSPKEMLNDITEHLSLIKTFESVFIGINRKKGEPEEEERREIFGITPFVNEKIVVRRIGFYNPKEVEKRYLEKEDSPEEVPYWNYYNLGEEWEGTAITRDGSDIRLTNGRVVVRSFKAVLVFKQR